MDLSKHIYQSRKDRLDRLPTHRLNSKTATGNGRATDGQRTGNGQRTGLFLEAPLLLEAPLKKEAPLLQRQLNSKTATGPGDGDKTHCMSQRGVILHILCIHFKWIRRGPRRFWPPKAASATRRRSARGARPSRRGGSRRHFGNHRRLGQWRSLS